MRIAALVVFFLLVTLVLRFRDRLPLRRFYTDEEWVVVAKLLAICAMACLLLFTGIVRAPVSGGFIYGRF